MVFGRSGNGGGMGRGIGKGTRRGSGYGFRGSSPEWPYAGRGRGGLPRCQSFNRGNNAASPDPAAAPAAGNELGILKNQAEALRQDLAEIERRISDIEKNSN